MTFGKPRLGIGKIKNIKPDSFELIRFCNKLNTTVVGGASKLLNHFIKTEKPLNIYSFSDNRWSSSTNNMYLNIGFKLVNISLPGYWYTTNKYLERIHRYNFNKRALKKMGADITKTEYDIMDSLGYARVWDCGTTRYELNIL